MLMIMFAVLFVSVNDLDGLISISVLVSSDDVGDENEHD